MKRFSIDLLCGRGLKSGASAACCFSALVLGSLAIAEGDLHSAVKLSDFHIIEFKGISPTIYRQDGESISADVKSSSSFLLKDFPQIEEVKSVSWKWKLEGGLSFTDADRLKTKGGDDAVLRIGFIESGKPPMVPFFAPAWVKSVRDFLKFPGDKLRYLEVGGPATPGDSWESPYSSSLTIEMVPSQPIGKGWFKSDYQFKKPVNAVGLWIMADGDDSHSSFKVWLKDLAFSK